MSRVYFGFLGVKSKRKITRTYKGIGLHVDGKDVSLPVFQDDTTVPPVQQTETELT